MDNNLIIAILLIGSYLIGAIPFAFIFTKIFSHKNIMEVGWQKSSASNVMKNIGKLPGILTFIFDFLKGFLLVYLAKELNQPEVVQALCGFMAVIGHNWSIFLKFGGGRGLATLLGAAFAINIPIMLIILIPLILLALVWTASIGTIIAYITAMILAYCYSEYGLFILLALSLIPVIIKRVSPLKNSKGKIKNRLLFDQDNIPPFRIGKK